MFANSYSLAICILSKGSQNFMFMVWDPAIIRTLTLSVHEASCWVIVIILWWSITCGLLHFFPKNIELPSKGWTCEFADFPDFSNIAIKDFTSHTGKKIGKTCVKLRKKGLSILWRAIYTWVHDLPEKIYFFIKGNCFHSQ